MKEQPIKSSREHSHDVSEDLERENAAKEAQRKEREGAESSEPDKKPFRSDLVLLGGIAVIVLLFVSFFGYSYFSAQDRPETVEEMHQANLEGDLDSSQGFVYEGVYSFITIDGFWYTELISPGGQTLFNLAMRHSPREVEGMQVRGSLNVTKFDNASEYYVTFNPEGSDFSYVTLAVGEFNQHMASVYKKLPNAACDRDSAIAACEGRPVVTCDSTDEVVLYVNESADSSVIYDENCIVVSGSGLNLTRGVDRVLYDLYGIIPR